MKSLLILLASGLIDAADAFITTKTSLDRSILAEAERNPIVTLPLWLLNKANGAYLVSDSCF